MESEKGSRTKQKLSGGGLYVLLDERRILAR